MTQQPKTRRLSLFAVAVVVPLAIALAFGHPARRVLVPAFLMLVVVVVVTLIGGARPGFVAAASSIVTLWFYNVPPGLSFRLSRSDDTAAVVLSTGCMIGLVVVVDRLQRTDRATAVAQAKAQFAVEAQGQTIATMQRALLPRVVPSTTGITVGSYYQTGDGEVPVGGDWFAFVPCSPCSLGLAIGDVAGHGLGAVTAMAEYRYALRVVATEHSDPVTVLERFAAVTAMYRRDTFTSCVYGVLDAAEGTFTFANAGHLPPILVRGNAAKPISSRPHGPVVGVDVAEWQPATTETLEDGDCIVLFTDGLVERRGEHLDTGIGRLCSRLANLSPERLDEQCRLIASELAGPTASDDVALVIARYAPNG